ncbi:MAG: transposase [Bacteroidia bacterium]
MYRVIQWFKTMSTNEYIRGVKNLAWQRFDKKVWQRNYWDHIIRNQESYVRISQYIRENPENWDGKATD